MTLHCDKRFITAAAFFLMITLFSPGCRIGSMNLHSRSIPLLSGSKKPPILFLAVAPDEQSILTGQRINSPIGSETIPVFYCHDTVSNAKHSFEAASALNFSGVFLDNGQTVLACDKKGITYLHVKDGRSENLVPKGRARLVSPKGDAVACVSQRGQWRIYSPQTQTVLCELPENVEQVIAFSPVAPWIACSVKLTDPNQSGTAKIEFMTFDSDTPQTRASFELDYYASDQGVFSPDGLCYATIRSPGSVGIWDVATGKLRHSINDIDGVVQTLAFSPDGTKLAIGVQAQYAKMFIWNTQNSGLDEIYSDRFCEGITSACFAVNGEKIYFGDSNGNVKLWDRTSKHVKKVL